MVIFIELDTYPQLTVLPALPTDAMPSLKSVGDADAYVWHLLNQAQHDDVDLRTIANVATDPAASLERRRAAWELIDGWLDEDDDNLDVDDIQYAYIALSFYRSALWANEDVAYSRMDEVLYRLTRTNQRNQHLQELFEWRQVIEDGNTWDDDHLDCWCGGEGCEWCIPF